MGTSNSWATMICTRDGWAWGLVVLGAGPWLTEGFFASLFPDPWRPPVDLVAIEVLVVQAEPYGWQARLWAVWLAVLVQLLCY